MNINTHPNYMTWRDMKRRCLDKKNKDYASYGGRGITVCQRWMSFRNFLSDMGTKTPAMTLDRIDNDGQYSPQNCRWADRKEQQRNSSNAKLLTFSGETLMRREWEIKLGLSGGALWHRLKNGWPLEKALSTTKRMS